MLRLSVLVLAVLACPAYASECVWSAPDGAQATVSPAGVDVRLSSGKTEHCNTFGNGTEVTVLSAACGDATFALFTAPSTKSGNKDDLLIFLNSVWYDPQCRD